MNVVPITAVSPRLPRYSRHSRYRADLYPSFTPGRLVSERCSACRGSSRALAPFRSWTSAAVRTSGVTSAWRPPADSMSSPTHSSDTVFRGEKIVNRLASTLHCFIDHKIYITACQTFLLVLHHIIFLAHDSIQHICYRLSLRLSDWVAHTKTVEVRIMKFSAYGSQLL